MPDIYDSAQRTKLSNESDSAEFWGLLFKKNFLRRRYVPDILRVLCESLFFGSRWRPHGFCFWCNSVFFEQESKRESASVFHFVTLIFLMLLCFFISVRNLKIERSTIRITLVSIYIFMIISVFLSLLLSFPLFSLYLFLFSVFSNHRASSWELSNIRSISWQHFYTPP